MKPLRTATEAEEQAAHDEAMERRVLPMTVLARQGLVARIDIGEFLEQVEQRCRDRGVLAKRELRGAGEKSWLDINFPQDQFGSSGLAVFDPGNWILVVSVQSSAGEQLSPEVAIERSRIASQLVRELLAEGLALPDAPTGPTPATPDEPGLFEGAMRGLRSLFARPDASAFLEQVERRAEARHLSVEVHHPGDGQDWLSIRLPAEFGSLSSFAVFGRGEWILTIHVQCSAGLQLAPEVSIDRSQRAAVLLRELLADGLESTQE